MRTSFYQYPYPDLQALWRAHGLTAASASMVYNWYYKKNRVGECAEHNLPRRTRDFLREHLNFRLPEIAQVHQSKDRTVKFLFRLDDAKTVETVLIPFQGKYSVCLSSQVGCAMNCSFCHTGKQGFGRHLSTAEIVGQLLGARTWLETHRPGDGHISNIVFMGQGEPLHNFDAVRDAAKIFISQHGLSLADHKVTVSTSGYVPGMKRWKAEMPDVNIALSLHAAFNDKRSRIIPINRRYPIEEIIPLAESIPEGKKRFVTYEYLLLKDFNDSDEDAHATGKLLKGKKALVNLIPFNSFPGTAYLPPAAERAAAFKEILETYELPVMIRVTKGDEILAACGQLNSSRPS